MNDRPLVELRSVSKYFCRDARLARRYGLVDIARALVPPGKDRAGPRSGEFASVDDVSFSVARGEGVAIMGQNGAGKTTLLRLIAGLIQPDAGSIVVSGRVNAVIELGQGLNPQLSGRENAELGLACRGIPRAQVSGLVASIVDFAELGEAVDSPVGTYSTGMRMRLSFGIAVHVPCDLLLIDEVLAVGDIRFQNKCMAVIRRHMSQGGALILISHQIPQILAVCGRGLVLDHGRPVFEGDVNLAADHYLGLLNRQPIVEQPVDHQSGDAAVLDIRVTSSDGGSMRPGGSIDIEVEYRTNKIVDVVCGLMVWTGDLSVCVTSVADEARRPAFVGEHVVRRCTISSMPLIPGTYAIRCSLLDEATMYPMATFGFEQPPCYFTIEGNVDRRAVLMRNTGQLVTVDHHWGGPRDSESPTLTDLPAHGGAG